VHKGRHIMTWRWGAPDAPAVVLAHGWGGHAAQMRAFVFPLLAAGYRVIAYDQPAHGLVRRRLTGLPDFRRRARELAWHHGEVRAVIGHSLGATAAAMGHAWGKFDIDRLVLISPPSDLVGYSRRFARWHWMPEPLRRAMQAAIEERYGVRWEELELARIAPHLTRRRSSSTIATTARCRGSRAPRSRSTGAGARLCHHARPRPRPHPAGRRCHFGRGRLQSAPA
jgi:alpha-beta hydrolase superfamily lysophospholipase